MKYLPATLCLFISTLSESQQTKLPGEIRKENVVYDFTLADLSEKYIETGDSALLSQIVTTEGLKLLYAHANWSGNNMERLSLKAFAQKIIDRDNKKPALNNIKYNLSYARDSVAATGYPQQVCLQYLPKGFKFSSRLCFTIGYDLGITYEGNSSVNVAHTHYLGNSSEIKYYSIHELHHAGFFTLKNYTPSPDAKTYGEIEMSALIAYLTELEGMAVYAAAAERKKDNTLSNDSDYVALQDPAGMRKYTQRYFEIYDHFLSDSTKILNEKDWSMFAELSSGDRLWYRVGSMMAETIDKKMGRAKLTGLIAEPSENFIKTYLSLKE